MRLLAAATLLVFADVTPSHAQQVPKTCSVDSASFARIAGAGIYRDCDVDKAARLRNTPDPRYVVPREKSCVSATLEFVVDSAGVPDTMSVLVVETDDREFAQAAIKTLSRWRYEPAVLQGRPVSQMVRERRMMEGKRLAFTVDRLGQGTASPPPPRNLPRSAPCR